MEQDRLSTDDLVLRPAPRTPEREADRRAMLEPDHVALDGLSAEDAMPQPADPASPSESAAVTGPSPTAQAAPDSPLLDPAQTEDFLQRWRGVQARFVDDPQAAVQDGDTLVAELLQALAARFAQHKTGLEREWQSGAEPGTEELRLALQSYRSFFQRLLHT